MNLEQYWHNQYRNRLLERGWKVASTTFGWKYQPPESEVWLTEEEAFRILLQAEEKEKTDELRHV